MPVVSLQVRDRPNGPGQPRRWGLSGHVGCNGGRRAAAGDEMSNDGDRRWHCWPGLHFLSRGRCGRACQATTWLVVCRCAALHALWRPSVPGVPNDIFLSHALLLRHPQQSYKGGAKLWRGAVYRSTTRVSSRLPKTFARRLAADLFSRRNARADAHSSFGIFKGYLSWTFR